MARERGIARTRTLCGCVVCVLLVWCGPARAAQLTLADGRVLEGRVVEISGVAVNPLGNGGGEAKLIVMCDDDLTRTIVPKRLVAKVNAADSLPTERFHVPQDVAGNGVPLASLGAITRVTSWDKFGHRSLSMAFKDGPIHVIQGLTEITPRWSKAESLKQAGVVYSWDMRIATSSLPRDLLQAILERQIDAKDPDHRLRLVRFYMQAERFQDAAAEVQQMIKDFPNLPNINLNDRAKAIRQLVAQQLLSEAELRGKARQHPLAQRILNRFPTKDINGPLLQAVRDKLEEYAAIEKRRKSILQQIDELAKQVKDKEILKQIKPIRDEIASDLSIATLDRLAPFALLAGGPGLIPEQKLALAISGWLLGPNDAIDNVQTALSLAETRNIIRGYLAEPLQPKRAPMLESLGSQQGASPKYVAELLVQMKPPIVTPAQEWPGFFKLEIRGIEDGPNVAYFVQLPPEYNPYIKYPTIVTLHAAGTTPEQQIDWWAGERTKRTAAQEDAGKTDTVNGSEAKGDAKPAEKRKEDAGGGIIEPGMRSGQATRHGYIVIAPAWTAPNQMQYAYSAREHAAVLGALRDAGRRFSIDTDRVYLSGHSIGGDAAWDVALAHPDLWAGAIPIIATSGKFVERYWTNGQRIPMYFVSGELDGNKRTTNGPQLDRYFFGTGSDLKTWDATLVEYRGRGHENFSDEILRIFDWMGRKRRDFFPKKFSTVTMRSWDRFFWCVELALNPQRTVDPADWPPPKGTPAFGLEASATATNGIHVTMHAADKVTVWLSPEWVDFTRPINVTINGNPVATTKGASRPSIPVMLEDARTRGDRQHPFWAKVER